MNSIDILKTQERFLSELTYQGRSFNTIKNYKEDLQCFNNFWTLKKRPFILKGFTFVMVQEYGDYLDQKYSSANSIRRRVQALRLYFDYLVTHCQFPDNPIKQLPTKAKVLDAPTPTSYGDLLKIHHFLKQKIQNTKGLERLLTYRNLIVFYMIYDAGVKVSDIAKLNRSDILSDGKTGLRLMVVHPKRDPYSIPLSQGFRSFYAEYLKLYDESLRLMDIETEKLLFYANPFKILNGGLSPRGTELIFADLRTALSLEITARSLRQACVFKWLSQGHPENLIKEWLGVAPDYDIRPYTELYNKRPSDFMFMELPHE